jgi:hypothetical protein
MFDMSQTEYAGGSGRNLTCIGPRLFRVYSIAFAVNVEMKASEIAMSEPFASQFISRRRLFWLAAMAAAIVAPASMPISEAIAQSDQAPAAEPSTPKKKTKSTKTKTKAKKTTPGDTMAPAANPPAAPKQQ